MAIKINGQVAIEYLGKIVQSSFFMDPNPDIQLKHQVWGSIVGEGGCGSDF